nr:heterogeneous nuclear ribonucleoprotein [Hymenolepis microstoma]
MAAFVRIRGLPYSATAEDVLNFFKDVKIKNEKRGVSFPQGPNGRSNGEAFVELENEDELEAALSLHKKHMGKRYIEVFRSDESEKQRALGWQPTNNSSRKEYFARLRGLPYDTEKQDIFRFFNDLTIAPDGIGLLVDHLGRCTGEAYVQFTSAEMLERAKEKHLEKIGRRYIEIFDATGIEASMAIRKQHELNKRSSGGPMMRGRGERPYYGPPGPHRMPPPYHGGYDEGGYGYGGGRSGPPYRPSPYSRPPGGYGYDRPPSPLPPRGPYGGPDNSRYGGPPPRPLHIIRMRGLPFQTTTEEIAAFFTPVQPLNVQIHYNVQGRPNGEADAEFATHDEACEAMKKDREKIGSRYIELFLESCPDRHSGVGGPGSNPATPSTRYGGGAPRGGSYYGEAHNDNGAPGSNIGNYYGSGGDYGYPSHTSSMDDRRYGDMGGGRHGDSMSGNGGAYGVPPQLSSQGGNLDNDWKSEYSAPGDMYDRYDGNSSRSRDQDGSYYW